jgi:hypothetical protein
MSYAGYGLIWLIVVWIIPIPIAISQGRSKDRAGLAYGLFLGWIGVIILAFLPARKGDKFVECPFCKESIRRDALVCPHCQREVRPQRQVSAADRASLPPAP